MTTLWNNTKTAVLLGLLFGLVFIGAFYITGGGVAGLIFALLLGGGANLAAFFFSDKIAIASMRGKQVDESTHPGLVRSVRRLAQTANLPEPRVYVCPQQAPNAFATGRSPRRAAVAVTEGALQLLSDRELEGVLGHELAHVKNRDTLISTMAATIAGGISALTWFVFFLGGDGDDNPLGFIGLLLFILLAPLAAGLIQMAISRSREYVADQGGAEIAGSPEGLIAALQKLEAMNHRTPMQHQSPSQNHLFIVQPLSAASGKGRRGGGGLGGMAKLFSTHPPTEERIARLRGTD